MSTLLPAVPEVVKSNETGASLGVIVRVLGRRTPPTPGCGRLGPSIHELHDRHPRRVTRPNAELYDPRIAATACRIPLRQVAKELLDDGAAANHGCRLSSRMKRPTLSERDEPITPSAQLLRLCLRGPYGFVIEELRHEIAKERFPMGTRPAELLTRYLVTHGSDQLPLAL